MLSSQRWEVLLEEQDLPESVHSSCDIVLLTGKASAFEQHVEVAKHLLRQEWNYLHARQWIGT